MPFVAFGGPFRTSIHKSPKAVSAINFRRVSGFFAGLGVFAYGKNFAGNLGYKLLQLRRLAPGTKTPPAEALLVLGCFSGKQSLIVL